MRTPAAGHVHRVWLPALALAATATACGSDSASHRNEPRPPAPINITAAITDSQVKVSPRRFGAGPIVLIISNQSSEAQAVTFQTGGRAAGIRRTTSAINPAGTAQLQLDVRRGSYRVSVDDRRIRPASLHVGTRRPSAQAALLQP